VVGYPGVPIERKRTSKQLKSGGKELDANGMYLCQEFVDITDIHKEEIAQGARSEICVQLWMAHGVTTVGSPSGIKMQKKLKQFKRKK